MTKMIEATIQIMNARPGSDGCFNTTSIANHSLSMIAMLLWVHLQTYPTELLLIPFTFLQWVSQPAILEGYLVEIGKSTSNSHSAATLRHW